MKSDYLVTECSKCNSSYSVRGCSRHGNHRSAFAPGKSHYCGGTMMETYRLRQADDDWVMVEQ